MRWRRLTRSDVNVKHRYARTGQQLASGAIDCVLPCLADAPAEIFKIGDGAAQCPSNASSFSIRTKIRSSDPAIVSHVTSSSSMRRGNGRNGRRAHRQRRSAAHWDHSASSPSRQLLR
jgi:hypothetical protein